MGPGPRLGGLGAVLSGLCAGAASPPSIEALGDLEQLARSAVPAPGRLVLDADETALDDLGYVRRFLERQPAWGVVLVGERLGLGASRGLLAHARVRWMPWPPDLVELEGLLERPEHALPTLSEPSAAAPSFSSYGPTSSHGPRRSSSGAAVLADDELARIQAVLAAPPVALRERPAQLRGNGRRTPDDEPTVGLEPLLAGSTPQEKRSEAPHAPHADLLTPQAPPLPIYYRAQVADLADIAQRVDLALRALRPRAERAAADDDGYEPLAGEVARLVQFTRTLGYLVAPPARGAQSFDLSVLVEELLGQCLLAGADVPRCRFRSSGALTVRSEKGLLTQALDAFLVLSRSCANVGEVVRVEALCEDAGDTARISIDFPEGPLAGLLPERIVEPYALREVLPELGPNALRAAAGIIAGQGGRAQLTHGLPGRLCWVLELPLAATEPA